MKRQTIFLVAIILLFSMGLLPGQTAAQSPSAQGQSGAAASAPVATSPVAKQPTAKSAEEVTAVRAMVSAPDDASRIAAANDLIKKFPDSEFKPMAFLFMTITYQQMNDYDKTVIAGEQTIKADPSNYQAMLILARVIAARTRENDLDREEKLNLAENYAKRALEVMKAALRPNPNITDEQWAQAKKQMSGQAYEALGMAAVIRNQNDQAIKHFELALEVDPPGEPATSVRLANAYDKAGKYDEAIAVLDKVLARPDLNPTVRQIAQAEKTRAEQSKAKGGPAAP